MKALRNSRAITLVELLIVIVILGIIAAIAVPAVGNIVENAEKDAVLADATQIRSSAQTAIVAENWAVGDWDWHEDEDGQPDEDDEAGVLTNIGLEFENTNTSENDLADEGYIDIDHDFVAWIYDGEWIVAIQTEDWTFVGNPVEDDARENVFGHEDELEDIEIEALIEALSNGEWPFDEGDGFDSWLNDSE